MRRRKKQEEEHGGLERWLITYADLITLLLAFFILMYTMSKQDAKKYEEVAAHLRAIFSGNAGILAKGSSSGKKPMEVSFKGAAQDTAAIRAQLEKEIRELGDQDKNNTTERISLINDERGLVVRAMEKAFFETGKADLSQNARRALDGIAPVLKGMPNPVRVEGHTDNVPINTFEFRSNWELSVRRATEVVRHLIERHAFPPERISATGYAEYRPLVSNDTPENRSQNRRIEIVILKTDETKTPPEKISPQ
ncbi:MAG: OmpA/MotB domain protein [Deltaproteobacteria bacterium]|jgi:chemotaxis protein MotB|nr:OmpA/MotB domain protein [Deltaproteobacteria bacterium]